MVNCDLCEASIAYAPVLDEGRAFCCTGCSGVYRILAAKAELDNYRTHPLFKYALQAGIIANPDLLTQIAQEEKILSEEASVKLVFEISGMWCSSCALVIRLLMMREKGVKRCLVDYTTDICSLEFCPRFLSKERIFHRIKSLGYLPCLLDDLDQKRSNRALLMRFLIALFFSMNIMMLSYPLYVSYFTQDDGLWGELLAWISACAALPVLFYSGFPIFRRCYHALSVGWIGMEFLVTLGVIASFSLSLHKLLSGYTVVYFDSMTVVIALVLLGKMVENKAKFSAKESLRNLLQTVPKRGRKYISHGTCQFVPLKEVVLGDRLVVMAGEKIVLDGEVVEGEGLCDEASMTGESLPAVKGAGSTVLSGTLLQQGWLVYRVTTTQEGSLLRQLVDSVCGDLEQKAASIPLIDRIVQWFVPLVVLLALLVGLLTADPLRAIAILLISCPCAVGIAAPLAESRLISRLAKMGAVVRHRSVLTFLGQETIFVCDKTGTITEGRFQLVKGAEGLTDAHQTILRSLAAKSNHPIAIAIERALKKPLIEIEQWQEILGQGISCTAEGERYFLGSLIFIGRFHEILAVQKAAGIGTEVYFASEKQLLATLQLTDEIKEGAQDFLVSLTPAKSLLLSGDAHGAVEKVARACGFEQFIGEQSPLQKRELILRLRNSGECVAMLGDGVNDAPALTAAHLAISVVNAADLSIQVSDLMLTSNRLTLIKEVRQLAIWGRRIIYQNLFWAFFYNIIGIGLASCGLLTPIFAALAMVLSSCMVVANSRRIY